MTRKYAKPGALLAMCVRAAMMISCLSLLAACSATGPLFSDATPIPPGKGRLYVFRPDVHAMSVVKAVFRVDAVPALELDNNGYSELDLAPGGHVIAHEWGKKLYTTDVLINKPVFRVVHVEAGKTSYVMLSSQAQARSSQGTLETNYSWQLIELDSADGRSRIATARYQAPLPPATPSTPSTPPAK